MRSLPAVLLTLLLIGDALAQESGFKQEFLRQYNSSAQKLISLAEAMPADSYDWRPMEGVASVADAYMHIAYYNYYYPQTSLGAKAPSDVAIDEFEDIEEKGAVVEQLRRSLDHVIATVEAMPSDAFEESTQHYGRSTSKRAVLLSLIVHMNEHLGQQIAYARSNRVVPPWSQ